MHMKIKKTYWWIVVTVIGFALACAMKVEADMKENAPLSGVVIVVDPGHGGKDDGARAEGVKEQDINLAISMKLKSALETQGAKVILTRDGAYDLASEGAKNRKKEDMRKRADIINAEPVDLFMLVHLNAYANTSIHGAHAFYRKDDVASIELAEEIQKEFNALTGVEKEKKSGDYFILNETNRPGVLVECGFLSNADDREKLCDKGYQTKLADAITRSILSYLHVLTI